MVLDTILFASWGHIFAFDVRAGVVAVSYTHLTLPTTPYV